MSAGAVVGAAVVGVIIFSIGRSTAPEHTHTQTIVKEVPHVKIVHDTRTVYKPAPLPKTCDRVIYDLKQLNGLAGPADVDLVNIDDGLQNLNSAVKGNQKAIYKARNALLHDGTDFNQLADAAHDAIASLRTDLPACQKEAH